MHALVQLLYLHSPSFRRMYNHIASYNVAVTQSNLIPS
jgi:hypothetical protein